MLSNSAIACASDQCQPLRTFQRPKRTGGSALQSLLLDSWFGAFSLRCMRRLVGISEMNVIRCEEDVFKECFVTYSRLSRMVFNSCWNDSVVTEFVMPPSLRGNKKFLIVCPRSTYASKCCQKWPSEWELSRAFSQGWLKCIKNSPYIQMISIRAEAL